MAYGLSADAPNKSLQRFISVMPRKVQDFVYNRTCFNALVVPFLFNSIFFYDSPNPYVTFSAAILGSRGQLIFFFQNRTKTFF